jgi:hypothetical protein
MSNTDLTILGKIVPSTLVLIIVEDCTINLGGNRDNYHFFFHGRQKNWVLVSSVSRIALRSQNFDEPL